MLENILNDLRFALRQLRRSPGFAITAVLTLALGIGANTAIFSLLDQALLRALPVRDAGALVVLEGTGKAWNGSFSSHGGPMEGYFSYPMYKDLRDQNHAFSGLIATSSTTVGFTRDGAAQFVDAELVSGNYFDTLGVQPALGRLLTASDDGQPGAQPVAVVGYEFWQGKLGANPAVVGSTVAINGHPFQIVGVAASGFRSAVWGQLPGLYVPMAMLDQVIPQQAGWLTEHTSKWLNILGRLKSGESLAQAQADVAPLWHALRAEELKHMGTRSPRFIQGFLTDSRLNVLPGARGFSYSRDSLEKPFLAVMAMALLVLLIASVNVASLLLVRAAGRVREFSLRSALGARRSRIVAQLLLEGTLVGLLGGLLGLLLAPFAMHVLVARLASLNGANAFSATIDGRVLAFNFAVAIVVSVGFSLAPALQLRKPNLTATLRESSSTGAGGLLQLRRVVVCLQVGLSVILLVGAGLFLRTMQRLRAVDVGFNTSHLVVFAIDPQLAGYSLASMPALHRHVLDGLAAIPGVQAVGATTDEELAGNSSYSNVTVTGYREPPEESFSVETVSVTPNYLAVMQVPLVAGRALAETDTLDHPGATVVNQAFARHFCGAPVSCLGRRMGMGGGNEVKMDIEIVGIAQDMHHAGIRDEVVATMYRPLRQTPNAASINLYVRTSLPPEAMFHTVEQAMHRLDPALSLSALHSVDQQIDDNLRNERMIALLATAFGMLATALAGVGLYGVLAYSTMQRTREIGIRMALGSTRAAVSKLVLFDVLRLAALGLVVAVPVAVALGRMVQAQLFGVSAADPAILLSVAGLIGLVALLAALLPARRAATVEPTVALRTE